MKWIETLTRCGRTRLIRRCGLKNRLGCDAARTSDGLDCVAVCGWPQCSTTLASDAILEDSAPRRGRGNRALAN